MIISDIMTISAPPLILLFLFKLLWGSLTSSECKFSSWALTFKIAFYVLQKCCWKSSEDHGCTLCLIKITHEIAYLQINWKFGVSVILFIINYSVCWQIPSVFVFSLEDWDSGLLYSNMKTVLLKSYKSFIHCSTMPTLSQNCVMVWLMVCLWFLIIPASCSQDI